MSGYFDGYYLKKKSTRLDIISRRRCSAKLQPVKGRLHERRLRSFRVTHTSHITSFCTNFTNDMKKKT